MSFFAELKRRNVVRVAAAYLVISWLLLQVSDVLFEALAVPDWATKLLIAFLALGLLPALIFSWVYELTPEGVKRESEVIQDGSITRATGRKLDYITLGALVLVTVLFLADRFIGIGGAPAESTAQAVTETGNPSVAVLPFVNMSGNEENEYFSDGLTETLLHMLAQVPNLKVAARTSSFAFKGKDVDIREIAAQLGVTTVLEGSVQRSGDRVRITAQLIDSSDGTHLWSDNFDRTLDDIFAIQDEIATEVVSALSATLLIEQPDALVGVATEDLGAYDYYLQGLTQRAIGSYGSLSEAVGLFKDALAQDPDFHDAKLALARTYLDQVGTGSLDDEEGLKKGEALAGQVLAARPDDLTAEGILVLIEGQRAMDRGDFAAFTGMIEPLKDIVEQLPNEPMFRGWLAALLGSQGEDEAALAMIRGTLEIDPLNARAHQSLADRLIADEQFEEAEEVLHRALELAPEAPNIYGRMARVTRRQGRLAEAVDWLIQASEVDSQDHELPSGIAQMLYLIGLPEEGDVFRRRAEAIAPSEGLVRSLLPMRAWTVGEDDEALELSRELIDDDIDTRQDGWSNTLRLYLYLMADQGRNREAVDYVEERYPGSTAYDQPPQSFKVMMARFSLLAPLSSLIEDDAELASMTKALYALADQAGFDWRDQPEQLLGYLYFTGDLEGARVAALEHLERPLAWNLDWRLDYTRPAMADLVADPAIRARLDEYRREEVRLREEVREMLAERANRT